MRRDGQARRSKQKLEQHADAAVGYTTESATGRTNKESVKMATTSPHHAFLPPLQLHLVSSSRLITKRLITKRRDGEECISRQ